MHGHVMAQPLEIIGPRHEVALAIDLHAARRSSRRRECSWLTNPSEVARCAFFCAAACPFFRRMLIACSISPLASINASRQRRKPAPVRSRRSFTSCADTFFPVSVAMMARFLLWICQSIGPDMPVDQILTDAYVVRSPTRFTTRARALRLSLGAHGSLFRRRRPSARLPRSRLPASRTLRRRWCRHNPRPLRRPLPGGLLVRNL